MALIIAIFVVVSRSFFSESPAILRGVERGDPVLFWEMQQPFLTQSRYVRQAGPVCSFALVVVAWHPYHRVVVENGTVAEELPSEFFQGVKDGILGQLGERPVRAVLVDGLHHQTDSSRQSFMVAAQHATRQALPRLLLEQLPSEEREARQIALSWQRDRALRLEQLSEHLSRELGLLNFHFQEDTWCRRNADTEQLIRLVKNAPRVPTEVDLSLTLAYAGLVEFLGVESWREKPGRLPQELAEKKLSTLIEETYELDDSVYRRMSEAAAEWALLYLDSYPDAESLLEAPGQLDDGTRSALLYLSGQHGEAEALAREALENSLGNRRQRKFASRVLEQLS
ncbi:MAG: hypothetical protein WC423_08080 [Vulcanimicrobiota bacterium]